MNSTSAAEVIIQALWPGPDVVASVERLRRAVGDVRLEVGEPRRELGVRSAREPAPERPAQLRERRGAAAAGAAAGGSSAAEGRVVITKIAAEKARKRAMRGMVFVMSKSFWFGE